MKFLFCKKTDEPNSAPAEEVFLKQKVPRNMVDRVEKSEGELVETYLKWNRVMTVLGVIRYIAFLAGIVSVGRLLNLGVPITQGYHYAPHLYWIGGCGLLLGFLLLIICKKMATETVKNEEVTSEIHRMDAAEESIRQYLYISENTKTMDILSFSYEGNEKYWKVHKEAQCQEINIFSGDDCICAYNGEGLYSFPKNEITGIRVVYKGVTLSNCPWDKNRWPSKTELKGYGAVVYYDEIIWNLKFFCALDISHSGETYSLLFPAFYLPVMTEVTGLSAPDFSHEAIAQLKKENKAGLPKDKLYPVFYWKAPKGEASSWFSPTADDDFKAVHPVAYVVINISIFVLVFLPCGLFVLAASHIIGSTDSNWLAIGCIVGGPIVGCGLANIALAWLHQYLGHRVTFLCFLVGGAVMAASMLLAIYC